MVKKPFPYDPEEDKAKHYKEIRQIKNKNKNKTMHNKGKEDKELSKTAFIFQISLLVFCLIILSIIFSFFKELFVLLGIM